MPTSFLRLRDDNFRTKEKAIENALAVCSRVVSVLKARAERELEMNIEKLSRRQECFSEEATRAGSGVSGVWR